MNNNGCHTHVHTQTTKLNISDMASMMPQDTGEAAGLLPKLVELQNKVARIEGQADHIYIY